MKENIYDNDAFFQKYSRFPRSVEGLTAAGEWHELKKLLPDFTNKRVLDIGCGFGWHCQYAAEHGASSVLGCDISAKMLAVAKQKNSYSNVDYQQVSMEDLNFPTNSFDIVMSSLALHYTPAYQSLCQQISQWLVTGGDWVFSVEHPIFTANDTQEWIYDDAQQPLHWPVDNYFFEGKRHTTFLGQTVVKYHRTLTTYLNMLIECGFMITTIKEPEPAEHLLNSVPGMKDELRRPMMLLIAAKKC